VDNPSPQFITLFPASAVQRTGATSKVRGNRSTKVIAEYDCKEGRIRVLQEEYFSGQMGAGERLGGNSEPSNWFSAVPGTRGATLLKFVCSRSA
jgi:hypothetical protein